MAGIARRLGCFYLNITDAEIAAHNQKRLDGPGMAIAAPKPVVVRQGRPGYIYLMHGVGTPWYKIGKSGDPHIRQNQIGVLAPFEIKLIYIHQVDDMDAAERAFHALFAEKRASGEWFVLTEADIKTFVDGMEARP